MGRLAGKVAFITGAARGQGRAEAVRFAEEGADIIAVDICREIEGVGYPLATPYDLQETVGQVEARGRKIVATEVDVRDGAALAAALDAGVAELGGLDIVIANAGVTHYGSVEGSSEDDWETVLAINLTGVWKTCRAALPHLRARGGGSIVITSSAMAMMGVRNLGAYTTAKHGLTGLVRTLVNEVSEDLIRVNSVNPTSVATPMLHNEMTFKLFCPDTEAPGVDDMAAASATMHTLPIPWIEPVDVANAALFLASDESRYVTGLLMTVDAGITTKGGA